MDLVALASVITSGVIGIGGIAAAFYSARQPAKVAQEQRTQQRRAEAYLEVLRIVEREAQWTEAQQHNLSVSFEDVRYAGAVRITVPEPQHSDRATIAALLSAFSSQYVRSMYESWREVIDVVIEDISAVRWNRNEKMDPEDPTASPNLDDLNDLVTILRPREVTARHKLADAIASELGQRQPAEPFRPSRWTALGRAVRRREL